MQNLIQKYGGKGGGNPKSSQGFLENMPKDLFSEVVSLISTKYRVPPKNISLLSYLLRDNLLT
jgi:hypothetical protein